MKNLALLRKKKGLTQVQFAKLFGVSASTVAMWETGQRKPDYHTIVRLCEFFGADFEELLGVKKQTVMAEENIEIPVVGMSAAGGLQQPTRILSVTNL